VCGPGASGRNDVAFLLVERKRPFKRDVSRRGLAASRGAAAAVLAADLEDPPEALEEMTARWRLGASLVWAVRSRSTGIGSPTARGTGQTPTVYASPRRKGREAAG